MLGINRIYNMDCVDGMKLLDDEFIDLTVTSPPYDNLRKYHGYQFDFEAVAKELYRVTKPGGIVVWVVADATVNCSETGTSFRQALGFKDVGFNLLDTMIWVKTGGVDLVVVIATCKTQSICSCFVKESPKLPISSKTIKIRTTAEGTLSTPDVTRTAN